MRVSRQADYATRTIYYLSHLEPLQRASTKSIANAQNIPLSFLTKIISRLSVAGLIHTTRGSQGGVALTRRPSNISLLEVVEAIDGPILLNESATDLNDCEFSEEFPLRPVWCEVQSVLVNQLQNATFDQFGPD
ncbi:MAG: Rrf2 family transcriptional regulator [Anaerolineales bacterium]|nr:Rrf2 family transcriptional regulator [Anaerolineales bacterium]MCK5427913.1 Rrf2 family transcriptional regulator [Anaerolineales bacterium]